MHREAKSHNSIFGIAWNSVLALMIVLLVLIVVVLFIVFTAQPAQGQSFSVIHSFTGGPDGEHPQSALILGTGGKLYGTTFGTVFRMSQTTSGWAFERLYHLPELNDGAWPAGAIAFDSHGALYVTAGNAPGGGCCGRISTLGPFASHSRSVFESWRETVLHTFTGSPDGNQPAGPLTFDAEGALYLTTQYGGQYGWGAVVKLTPVNGGWTENILYSFSAGSDGGVPLGGVIHDAVGNLYGTTNVGGTAGFGTIFQLTTSRGGWTENVLYSFPDGNGTWPASALVFDGAGNLYGTTGDLNGTFYGYGDVFMLVPSDGSWTFNVLYTFSNYGGSAAGLVIDNAGALYGTTFNDGIYYQGNVFKLAPSGGGSWTYTDLYDFFGGSNGSNPIGGIVRDTNGNIYGTADLGGQYTYYGDVWEITP